MLAIWTDRLQVAGSVAMLIAALFSSPAFGHSMPDTQIILARDSEAITLTIRASLEELGLVMTDAPDTDAVLTPTEEAALRAYFTEHTRIDKAEGTALPVKIEELRLIEGHHADIGIFEEVLVIVEAPVPAGEALVLRYDAILHEVANHRALVYGVDGTRLGILRFDLSAKAATVLPLDADAGLH